MDTNNENKYKNFRGEVRELIRGFTREQIAKFAWICAVRVLPFLSVKRGYAYWKEADRQKHLMSVFHAVDVAFYDTTIYVTAEVARAAAAAAAAAAVAAYAYAATDAAAYADAAAAAADAAAYAYADAYADAAAADAAAAAARAAARTYTTNKKYYESFINNIIEDIKIISENKDRQFNNSVKIYGEVWLNFLDDLKKIDCGYWANLYESLFANGFVVDEIELNRRLSVPDEIMLQGAAEVGRYLENLGDDVEQLNEARIIILGEKGAGKTSLAKKLLDINAPLPKEEESTEGVITSIWTFPEKDGDKKMNAHIWDFAGHSITHSAHRCFMSARCLYIYVYNGRIERDNDPAYWLEQIRIHGGDSPVMFLINEKDNHTADIAKNTLKKDYPSIVDYYHVNIGSEDKSGISDLRQKVIDLVQGNVSWSSQIISKEAYKIKAELRELFKKEESPHITRDVFNEIAERNGVKGGRTEEILSDLHALGLCLWYGKEEMKKFNALVLNPDYIADGIYRIINKGHKENKHIVNVDFGVEKLSNQDRFKYPRKMVEYLFELMRIYELAFFRSENRDRIFIPGILPMDMPNNLPEFEEDDLTMNFEVKKALPPNIVCRVIVQRNEEILDERLLWRKGAVLKPKDMDATALIQEDGLRIVVDVKGKDKTAYIPKLRETLEKIFEDYKSIKPDLKYKILLSDEVKDVLRKIPGQKLPEVFESADKIGTFVEENVSYFEIISKLFMSLNPTADAYKMDIGSTWFD